MQEDEKNKEVKEQINNAKWGENKEVIKTKEQARQYAIDYQKWASEQNLSYGELAEWQAIFQELAEKFDLGEEFKENGIL